MESQLESRKWLSEESEEQSFCSIGIEAEVAFSWQKNTQYSTNLKTLHIYAFLCQSTILYHYDKSTTAEKFPHIDFASKRMFTT